MRVRWLWLCSFAAPLLGGLLLVLLWSEPMAGVIFVGWPVVAVCAGLATWFTLRVHWVPRILGAGIVGFAFFMVVVPLLFFVSFLVSVAVLGDEDTSYFDFSF